MKPRKIKLVPNLTNVEFIKKKGDWFTEKGCDYCCFKRYSCNEICRKFEENPFAHLDNIFYFKRESILKSLIKKIGI